MSLLGIASAERAAEEKREPAEEHRRVDGREDGAQRGVSNPGNGPLAGTQGTPGQDGPRLRSPQSTVTEFDAPQRGRVETEPVGAAIANPRKDDHVHCADLRRYGTVANLAAWNRVHWNGFSLELHDSSSIVLRAVLVEEKTLVFYRNSPGPAEPSGVNVLSPEKMEDLQVSRV